MDNSWFYQEMAASNTPASTPSAPKQQPEKKVRRWIIPTAIAIIVLIFIPLFVIIAVGKNNNNNQDQIADNPEQPTEQIDGLDESLSTPEEDVHAYFSSLASSSDYQPSFEKNETVYSEPPADFSCDQIVEVSYMDLDIMNLELDYGFVVIVSGKGSAPFTSEGNSILVYGGSLNDSIYKTAPINCQSSSPITPNYTKYSGSAIFNNLSSDKHYFIWIDPKHITSGVE